MQQLRVVRAAILLKNGSVFSMEVPNRHHNIISLMVKNGLSKYDIDEQGFLLNDGSFCRRIPAGIIAMENGQITKLISPPTLTSEDLW